MKKIIREGLIIVLLAAVFFLIVGNWALAPRCEGGRQAGDEYETNVLSEVFVFCGVSWEEMAEKCETTNYIHRRNAAKKHAIITHKYNKRQSISEADAYFFIGNEDNCWLITCEIVKDGGAEAYIWIVKGINMEDDTAPGSKLFRGMLVEYMEEILMEIPGGGANNQSPLPRDTEKPKQGNGGKLYVGFNGYVRSRY